MHIFILPKGRDLWRWDRVRGPAEDREAPIGTRDLTAPGPHGTREDQGSGAPRGLPWRRMHTVGAARQDGHRDCLYIIFKAALEEG